MHDDIKRRLDRIEQPRVDGLRLPLMVWTGDTFFTILARIAWRDSDGT